MAQEVREDEILVTESHDPGKLYVYAGMYFQGITVPVDKEKAVRLYRMSAEKGNIDAQVRLGIIYMTGDGAEKDYSESFKWFKLASDRGNPDAEYFASLMYSRGWGTEKNPSEAVRLCYLAADSGCTGAMVEIAKWYRDGENLLAKSTDLCLAWLRRAADREYPDALYELGCMYSFGEGVEKDVKTGRILLEYAKRFGDEDAGEALEALERGMSERR
ncbi:Sel1 repeat protein [Thermoplasmatales archaeon BRNA1]|nr:Sel1 repeat protein [Thermoplasmatales archaeon BRNA1]